METTMFGRLIIGTASALLITLGASYAAPPATTQGKLIEGRAATVAPISHRLLHGNDFGPGFNAAPNGPATQASSST
jgi:hypothetical protein